MRGVETPPAAAESMAGATTAGLTTDSTKCSIKADDVVTEEGTMDIT